MHGEDSGVKPRSCRSIAVPIDDSRCGTACERERDDEERRVRVSVRCVRQRARSAGVRARCTHASMRMRAESESWIGAVRFIKSHTHVAAATRFGGCEPPRQADYMRKGGMSVRVRATRGENLY